MKRQNASEAIGNFFRITLKVAAVIFIIAFAFNHSKDDEVAYSNESSLPKTEETKVSLSDFKDSDVAIKTELPSSTFTMIDAFVEKEHLILVFDYENTSNEPINPYNAYSSFIDEITQEDDNAIYTISANHFFRPSDLDVEKISIGNPKIKPNGTFTFFVPYELENNSDVIIELENGTKPIIIELK